MNQHTEAIKAFLQENLSKDDIRHGKDSPMALISQVNWAMSQMGIAKDINDAWDIAREIFLDREAA